MLQKELKEAIAKSELSGVFLFAGEEDYLKRHYLSEIKKKIVTDEAFAPFNHIVFDGEEIDFGALSDAVAAPPFMADFKLIEWHFPNIDKLKDKEIEALESLSVCCKDYGYATVVFIVGAEAFDIGTGKKKSKLYERLSEICNIVVFDRSDDEPLAKWVLAHLSRDGVTANKELCKKIVERVGHSMEVLALEIDKLSCYIKTNGRSELTDEDISTVTSATFESDAFGLTNAIREGDAKMAFADLRDKKLRKVEAVTVVGAVSRVFSDVLTVSAFLSEGLTQAEIAKKLRMHEYKAGLYIKAARRRSREQLERALHICKEIDISAKSSGGDGYLGLERLITEILCSGRR